MVTMSVNTPSSTDPPGQSGRRIALGLIGLVVGLVIIFVGLNALSTSDAPPPETPRVQTGSLPPGTTPVATGSPSGPTSTVVAGGSTLTP